MKVVELNREGDKRVNYRDNEKFLFNQIIKYILVVNILGIDRRNDWPLSKPFGL